MRRPGQVLSTVTQIWRVGVVTTMLTCLPTAVIITRWVLCVEAASVHLFHTELQNWKASPHSFSHWRTFLLNSIPQRDINLLEQKRWLVSLTSYICQSLERAHEINIKDVKWGEKEWTHPWKTLLFLVPQFPPVSMEGIIRRGSGVWRQHSPRKSTSERQRVLSIHSQE